jgi:branched-chain amino acid transport system permease protein
MSIALSEGMRILTDSRPVNVPRVLEKSTLFNIFDAHVRIDNVVVIVAGAVIFIMLERFIKLSRMGKAIRAVSMSEETSKLMGVNLNRVITITFAIGGLATLVSLWVSQPLPLQFLAESAISEVQWLAVSLWVF